MDFLAKYNIVTNCGDYALRGYESGTGAAMTFTGTSNVYWNNDADVDGSVITSVEGSAIEENPRHVHDSRDVYPAGDQAPDGYYLSQNEGDRSVTPLRGKSITGMDLSHISDLPAYGFIKILAYDNLSYVDTIYTHSINGAPTQNPLSLDHDLCLSFVTMNPQYFEFAEGDYLTLTLENRDIIDVYLPEGEFSCSTQYCTVYLSISRRRRGQRPKPGGKVVRRVLS